MSTMPEESAEERVEEPSVTDAPASGLAHENSAVVTLGSVRAPAQSNAERQKRYRDKKKAQRGAARQLQCEIPDWMQYCSADRLPTKAGVAKNCLRRLALKEVMDNALDTESEGDDRACGGWRLDRS
jgi:hypothetical protein